MFKTKKMNLIYGLLLIILSLRSLGYILKAEYGLLGLHIIVFSLCLPGGIYYIYSNLLNKERNP